MITAEIEGFIISAVEAFCHASKNARVDPDYPFGQRLSSARERNVRVKREPRQHRVTVNGRESLEPSRIVQFYGQKLSWRLSFGCAEDVALLVDDTLVIFPPRLRP